jgi:hypothetical protein
MNIRNKFLKNKKYILIYFEARPIINCISVDMMVIKEWQEKDAQIKRGRKGPKAHRPPPLTAGVVFVLFKIFLILALHDTNADDGHSLCTLAKQESVERDLTPDIPEPIIVPFLWPPVSLFLPSLWPYTLLYHLTGFARPAPPPPHTHTHTRWRSLVENWDQIWSCGSLLIDS